MVLKATERLRDLYIGTYLPTYLHTKLAHSPQRHAPTADSTNTRPPNSPPIPWHKPRSLTARLTAICRPAHPHSASAVSALDSHNPTDLFPRRQPLYPRQNLNALPRPARLQPYRPSSEPLSRATPPRLPSPVRACRGRFGDRGRPPRGWRRRRCGAPSSTPPPPASNGSASPSAPPPPPGIYHRLVTASARPPRPTPRGSADRPLLRLPSHALPGALIARSRVWPFEPIAVNTELNYGL